MKELSLLMFVVACGYVLGRFLNRFAAGSVRQRNFFIPSQADSNLLWGFAFYFGFATLMFHSHHKIWPLAAIAAILVFLAYYKALRKNLVTPVSPFIVNDLRRRLNRQQENDRRLNRPYTRGEALRLLGLPAGIDDDSPQIAERLKLLSDFSTQTPDLPYLPEKYKTLISIFENKHLITMFRLEFNPYSDKLLT